MFMAVKYNSNEKNTRLEDLKVEIKKNSKARVAKVTTQILYGAKPKVPKAPSTTETKNMPVLVWHNLAQASVSVYL